MKPAKKKQARKASNQKDSTRTIQDFVCGIQDDKSRIFYEPTGRVGG